MYACKYNNFFYMLLIITNLAIPLLIIFLYKFTDYKIISLIAIIYFLFLAANEVKSIGMEIAIYKINQQYSMIILFKFLLLFIYKFKNCKKIEKYIVTAIAICILYSMNFYPKKIYISYDIIANIYFIASICINHIIIKSKQNKLDINKLDKKKEYISKIANEIEEQSIYYKTKQEELKLINQRLWSILEVINMPILIINIENLECEFKNKYFDDILKENNLDIESFEVKKFIKDYLGKEGKKIFQNLQNIDYSKKNYSEYEICGKKYQIVLVKEHFEEKDLVICELKDITHIHLKEEILKKSEAKYKTLMDILYDGVIIHDGINISYINKIAIDIFGLDISVKNVYSIDTIEKSISRSSKDDFSHNIFVLKNGEKDQEKSKLELDNGKIIEFISSSFMLNNKNMILSIVTDCTKNERALNKLHENRKTYETLLQTLPEGIILVNKYTKKTVYTNKYMMRLLKDMGVENFNNIIANYIENKEVDNFKTLYFNKDKNQKISILIRQIPKQSNLMIIVRDLYIEQQIEDMSRNLEMIKERNKYKTEFLIRVSHNLKKPINTIFEVNKYLENRTNVYNYEGVENYTNTVKKNSYRLKKILKNIEEISKIEQGVYCENYGVYDIVKYLDNLVSVCRDYTKEKLLDISFETNRKELLVYIDKDKVERMILNILSNAIKFTEKEGRIKVSLKLYKKNIIIAIEDNGSGIPDNKINIIFENFEQVNRSLSRTAEGTGVGLYLVQKLAFILNANIKVNSKIGRGSKFEIILNDNYLDSNKENKKRVQDIFIDKETIELEFSDIYLS